MGVARRALYALLIVVCTIGCGTHVQAAVKTRSKSSGRSVSLDDIRVLTLRKDKKTTARRGCVCFCED